MLDEQRTVELLRTGAGPLTPTTGEHVAAAQRHGRRLQRRRRAAQAVGGGAALGLAVALLIGLNQGSVLDVVEPAPAAPAGSTDGDPNGAPVVGYPREASRYNATLLVETLGPDFRAIPDDPRGTVELIHNTATARELPDGYAAFARILVIPAAAKPGPIAEDCEPMVEKGMRRTRCYAVGVMGGARKVWVQDFRTELGEWDMAAPRTAPRASDSTKFYYERSDGARIELRINAGEDPDTSTAERRTQAIEWLGEYTNRLADLTADPRVMPWPADAAVAEATPYPVPQAEEAEPDQAVLQEALGGSWSLIDGKVVLEPGSKKAEELPRPAFYTARARIGLEDDSVHQATCAGRTAAPFCEKRTLPDGRTLHSFVIAGWDENNTGMIGLTTFWIARWDGWTKVTVVLDGGKVTRANAERETAQSLEWLNSLEDALVAAVTDERVSPRGKG